MSSLNDGVQKSFRNMSLIAQLLAYPTVNKLYDLTVLYNNILCEPVVVAILLSKVYPDEMEVFFFFSL